MDDLIKISVNCSGHPAAPAWSYPGQNLWEALAANGLISSGACGGHKVCGKCKLKVKGALPAPDEAERYLLLPEEVKAGVRLACHIPVTSGLEVFIEEQPLAAPQLHTSQSTTTTQPLVSHKKIYLPGFDRQNAVSIQERLSRAVPGLDLSVSVDGLNELFRLDRADRPVLELNGLVDDKRRLIYAGKARQKLYGIALDIGTTTLVGSLLDLESNQTVCTATMPNMQRVYGDDIISRLQYVLSHDDGLQNLQQVIINNANTLITNLTNHVHSVPQEVYKLTMVGNPVMTHLFLGLSPVGLAQSPFCGIISDAYRCRAAELGLLTHPEAELLVPPQAAGFIGSDALVGILTLRQGISLPYLFIDLGTNSEVILAGTEGIYAASAAAGPAFEGAGIRCGMRAAPGAIDHCDWQDGALNCHVLGGGGARGMCGSALVDLLAWLLEKGLMNANGNLVEVGAGTRVRNGTQGREIVVVAAEQAFQGVPVLLSQEDVRRLQLAKAAVRAAIEVLLQESGVEANSLKAVFLAGAFGSFLKVENALKIGLLPEVKPDLVYNIGNAAGRGAARYMVDAIARQRIYDVKRTLKTISLSDHLDFQRIFLRHIDF